MADPGAQTPTLRTPESPSTTAGGSAAFVALACGGVAAAAAVALSLMGRSPWCRCGSPVPWSWDIWSMHNSQHLVDPYSFTHVLHGVVFFWLFAVILRDRWKEARWVLAILLESAWEIAENTDTVIDKYREATISLEYYGDSVLNSMADVAACALGYALATRLPWWAAALLFVGVELALAATIRDTLLINVLMLVHPVEAVKQWQLGA